MDIRLIDVALYYAAESSLVYNKELYLQGEFAYMPISFNTSKRDIAKRYIIPRTWFDFEDIQIYNAKIDYIACGNCGRSLIHTFNN